ncbi:hypothetical protein IFM89_005993 [Coptis chinensis]|uniref:Tubby C-terminal domain-containing protein n=1 Tax=Coptis chinensis TaxID=261450 RepID=A0A835I9A6_9MAGN|nr:hypothetical protein IFM89_005993 [Coptis chinensis]
MTTSGFKKTPVRRQSSYNSLYLNPLTNNELKHTRTTSDMTNRKTLAQQLFDNPNNKENLLPPNSKQQTTVLTKSKNSNVLVPLSERNIDYKYFPITPLSVKSKLLKSSSLQLCMQLNEPDTSFGLKVWDSFESDKSSQPNVWDHSDSEAAPASSWSTLPNRYLLCRPLPVDIGRCTCVIVKEASLEGLDGGSLYSLYTNGALKLTDKADQTRMQEGHGRQDRKLAVAHHRRRNGRSEFTVAQNAKGLSCSLDESILGTITSNFMGSRYHIWDQGSTLDQLKKQPKLLLAVVGFVPTITTCTGSYRSLKAWIPKHQSMQLKNTTKIQHINGLPKDWEVNMNKAQQLYSKIPLYNSFSKQHELDFRERGRAGLRIQTSVKNFQLTMEELVAN